MIKLNNPTTLKEHTRYAIVISRGLYEVSFLYTNENFYDVNDSDECKFVHFKPSKSHLLGSGRTRRVVLAYSQKKDCFINGELFLIESEEDIRSLKCW